MKRVIGVTEYPDVTVKRDGVYVHLKVHRDQVDGRKSANTVLSREEARALRDALTDLLSA